jgi:hypothetical protein
LDIRREEMENLPSIAILMLWLSAAVSLLAGNHGRTVWVMTGAAVANIVYGGFLLIAAGTGGNAS